jgi:hypothetical protein
MYNLSGADVFSSSIELNMETISVRDDLEGELFCGGGLCGSCSCVNAECARTGLQFVSDNVVTIVRGTRRIREGSAGDWLT